MSVEERHRNVRRNGYCKNCLAKSHATNECTSAEVCKKCGWFHHTLLHQRQDQQGNPQDVSSESKNTSRRRKSNVHDRVGPYHRPGQEARRTNDHSTRRSSTTSTTTSTTNSKRILLGALRALERLAKEM